MKNQINIIQDYIEIKKLLNIGKLTNNLDFAPTITKLAKIAENLNKQLCTTASQRAEIEVLDKQIQNLYIVGLNNTSIIDSFSQNYEKIKQITQTFEQKYFFVV